MGVPKLATSAGQEKEMKLMVAKRQEQWGAHASSILFHSCQMGIYDPNVTLRLKKKTKKTPWSFNFMAAVTIQPDFGAQENSLSLFPLFPILFAMK